MLSPFAWAGLVSSLSRAWSGRPSPVINGQAQLGYTPNLLLRGWNSCWFASMQVWIAVEPFYGHTMLLVSRRSQLPPAPRTFSALLTVASVSPTSIVVTPTALQPPRISLRSISLWSSRGGENTGHAHRAGWPVAAYAVHPNGVRPLPVRRLAAA